MPPRSPLPQRLGLDAAWLRTDDRDPKRPAPWTSIAEWLTHRVGEHIDVQNFLRNNRFVYQNGEAVASTDPYRPHTFVWFHRDLEPETPVPGEVRVIHRDDRLVVVDKPPFLSSIPRGKHISESVVVRMRRQLSLPELTPLHRLDRVTSGVLLMATERRWRGAYQSMFMRGEVQKTYAALADLDPKYSQPVTVLSRITKTRGVMRAENAPEAVPNAKSLVELESELVAAGKGTPRGLYKLTPHTGKTHQLRLHMWQLGIPIDGDPLYPIERSVAIDDFSEPLQLLARSVTFRDPVDGSEREFTSGRTLPL